MMKTARITFLGTPDFKQMLEKEAKTKRVSVGELIRARFGGQPTEEEREVSQLAALLKQETAEAHASLRSAIEEAQQVLRALRKAREQRDREAV
jgi:hypothetical protein